MESSYDGFVSRHLNRRISRPMAGLLSRTPVTPNQVSLAGLGMALAAFLSFAYGRHVFSDGHYIVAALLVQAVSIVDGVDGDLARLKGMTSAFGGFMDAVLDRYADTLVIVGLAMWASGDESHVRAYLAALWALGGTFAVTYTRARIEGAPRDLFDRGITSVASRDVRLFIISTGASRRWPPGMSDYLSLWWVRWRGKVLPRCW